MRSGDLVIFGCLQPQIKGYFCCSSSLHHLNPTHVKEEVCKSLLLPHSGIFGGGGANQTISLGTETRAQPVLPAHASASPQEEGSPACASAQCMKDLERRRKKKKQHVSTRTWTLPGRKKATAAIKLISFSNIYKTFSRRIMTQADQSL